MKKIIKLLLIPAAIFAASDEKDSRPRLLEYPQEVLNKILSYAGEIKTLGKAHPGLLEKLNKYAISHEVSAVDKWARFARNATEYNSGNCLNVIVASNKSTVVEILLDNVIKITNANFNDDSNSILLNLKDILVNAFGPNISFDATSLSAFNHMHVGVIVKVKSNNQDLLFCYLIDLDSIEKKSDTFHFNGRRVKLSSPNDIIGISPNGKWISHCNRKDIEIWGYDSGDSIEVKIPHTSVITTNTGICIIDQNNNLVTKKDVEVNKSQTLDISDFRSYMPGKRFSHIAQIGENILIHYENAKSILLNPETFDRTILEDSIGLGNAGSIWVDNWCLIAIAQGIKVWSLISGEIIKYCDRVDDLLYIRRIYSLKLSYDKTLLYLFYNRTIPNQKRLAIIDGDNGNSIKYIIIERVSESLQHGNINKINITPDQNKILVKTDQALKIFSISEAIEEAIKK